MDGTYKTLDSFGWSASQTPAVQRANVQSALDSGEPITLPAGEVVDIDETLIMDQCPALVGHGGKWFLSPSATSEIRSSAPDIGALVHVLKDAALVSGFHMAGVGAFTDRDGLRIGDGVTHTRHVTVDRMTSEPTLTHGVHPLSVGGLTLNNCSIWGDESAVFWENHITADAGDNKMTNCDLNANMAHGAGLRWHSGGGLYVSTCKFQSGWNHIKMDWSYGSSGGLTLTGCNLEGAGLISIDMDGVDRFTRAAITGNSFGLLGPAIAVRSFNPVAWFDGLSIVGNVIENRSIHPCIDLGSVQDAVISSNQINGYGLSSVGIITRAPSADIGIGANMIRGCATPIIAAPGTNVQPQF